MKNKFTKLAVLGLILAAASTNANAQLTNKVAAAKANAIIIAPITLEEKTEMNFGKISAGTGGTVTLTAAAAATTSQVGGVTLPGTAQAGTITSGKFDVVGESLYTYKVTLPTAAIDIAIGTSSDKMQVNNFTTNLTSNEGVLDGSGKQTFYVGADLIVGNGQKAGTYVGSYEISVDYN